MLNKSLTQRLAVLIDAENIPAKYSDALFEEIAKIGEASVRRAYGDFTQSKPDGWARILASHAIEPRQQFSNIRGKNASDILLVMDAMDLLHSGHLSGFCLVSSDSDFAGLAMRIRERGVDVFGFGDKQTPESFRQACKRFFYVENLLLPEHSDKTNGAPVKESTTKAIPILEKALEQLDDEDGWVNLSALGSHLSNLSTDFDHRSYGFAKLSSLIKNTGKFEVSTPKGSAMQVRKKPAGKRKVAR